MVWNSAIIPSMPRVEDYKNLLIYQTHLEWRAITNNPDSQGFQLLGQDYTLGLDLVIHPNQSGRIILNYPGYRGAMDGYDSKHKKLAWYMQGEGLGAVVRGKGPGFVDFDGFTDDIQLRKMIEYSLENAELICGEPQPELLFIGTSAGAGAVAAVAADYNKASKDTIKFPDHIIHPVLFIKRMGSYI